MKNLEQKDLWLIIFEKICDFHVKLTGMTSIDGIINDTERVYQFLIKE